MYQTKEVLKKLKNNSLFSFIYKNRMKKMLKNKRIRIKLILRATSLLRKHLLKDITLYQIFKMIPINLLINSIIKLHQTIFK
jgi:hypothetical protein